MQKRTLQLIVAVAASAILPATLGASAKTRTTKPVARTSVARTLPCGDLVGFQVLLDRQGFSPGQIDGLRGANFTHTLAAWQTAKKLKATGEPDCATWKALVADDGEPTITDYKLTDQDLNGPFEKRIPPKLEDQAKLDALGYQSPTEALAERFHVAPALLAQLNRGAPLSPGRTIKVPAVTTFNPDAKPARGAANDDVSIEVSRSESALRATKADGTLVFYAPVSSGSTHDPLPPGDWKVTGVSWHPVFHYNPDLFWDANPKDVGGAIQPGPNNPVGVVWIGLNLEHYGIHGTPEPGHVGHTESHGCVRLTNWDAARVAGLVKPGTRVIFK
ncbi:MAG TPA: L,D-transpeptidase family protein [Vicinamibacterales bacterium]|nr:L,D-transpeptidase family protein [Vicinamibacterales bacterium]